MRIVLTGGTGFIGSALRESLIEKGHEVVILTRRASRENQPGIRTRYRYWNPAEEGAWQKEVDGVDGVINLAGEPLVGKRWTRAQKQMLLESRTGSTQAIVRAIRNAKKKPLFLINASAVGYYGAHGDEKLTEENPHGKDFLGQLCQAWEAHALRAQDFGVRVVLIRIGIVLEKGGGALAKMRPPFNLGLGGPLGTGEQWMSWIHLADLIRLFHLAVEKKEIQGPVNGTAPNPVTMLEFAKTLGKVLHRPAVFPVPAFLLKILLGEMADVLLTGQRVIPKKAFSQGFTFQFPTLREAFLEILKK
ncbi:MAG: TIGR01777 family protein [Candidatus Omnitrophica bacterium]|nr:TIGR01777 family protein [Candidatus Omnitrophota bacterium]